MHIALYKVKIAITLNLISLYTATVEFCVGHWWVKTKPTNSLPLTNGMSVSVKLRLMNQTFYWNESN